MKYSLNTEKTAPAPPSTIRSPSTAVAEPIPADAVRKLALAQEQVDETEKRDQLLLSAENMEEHAGHILEQMTEFIKMATGGEKRPLPFGMSDPLDQILKGFNDNGGGNGGIGDSISNDSSGGEWGGGGGEEAGRSDSDNGWRVPHRSSQSPEHSRAFLEEELLDIPLEMSPSQQILQTPRDVTGCSEAPINDIFHYQNDLYQNLYHLIRRELAASPYHKGIIRSSRTQEALQEASESLVSLNNVILALSRARQYRAKLMEICSALNVQDSPPVREALGIDEKHIFVLLQQILTSKDFRKKAVLELQGENAESFMDLLQTTLDRYQIDPVFWRGARRLLVKLSEESGIIPASLTIQGVALLEKEAVFGGGFADIYRAFYNGKEVALKRMRVFQRGQERHEIHRTFCKEALIWQSLRHPHVLPFIGVDSDTFSPYLCMVSPWMQYGTIVRHLSENRGADVNKLLKEVAQGLEYLHSQNVVHGDLRGGNILINDEWQACLADFGLTVVSEATLATQTSNGHGSVRWMAPELHDPESFGLERFLRTFASDIYAFGCVCFEVYTSRAPFADISNDSAVMLQVLRGVRPRRPLPDVSRRMSDDVWGLIEQCWSQMPSERPEIHKIVEITGEWE